MATGQCLLHTVSGRLVKLNQKEEQLFVKGNSVTCPWRHRTSSRSTTFGSSRKSGSVDVSGTSGWASAGSSICCEESVIYQSCATELYSVYILKTLILAYRSLSVAFDISATLTRPVQPEFVPSSTRPVQASLPLTTSDSIGCTEIRTLTRTWFARTIRITEHRGHTVEL